MSINHSTGEVVAVDTSSEVALTGYLQQARDWLTTAVQSSTPDQIAAARAEIATAAEAAKQLHLSKEIRDDAIEMVRRVEYAVAKSIRNGQDAGEIKVHGQRGNPKNDYVRTRLGSTHVVPVGDSKNNWYDERPGARDIAPDFYNNGMEIGHLADATEEQFEEAIAEAKAEGNLSRRNVVRKVKGYSPEDLGTRTQRADAVRKLADKGWTSAQMVDRVGIGEPAIRQIARDFGIPIPGDRALNKQRRVNSGDIVDNLVIGLEGSVMSLDLVEVGSSMTTRTRHLHLVSQDPDTMTAAEAHDAGITASLAHPFPRGFDPEFAARNRVAVDAIVAESEARFGGTVTAETRALMAAIAGGAS